MWPDRIAAKALPVSSWSGTMHVRASEAAYVSAVRAASRDGVLTRREERHLAELAEHLGIGPRKALELWERVEADL